MARVAAVVLGILLALHGGLRVAASEQAPAETDAERGFEAAISEERSSRGLHALGSVAELTEVARRHAERMASEQRLHHNPHLQDEVHDWEVVGENVGRGSTVEDIHAAFMASPTHRDQILSTRYTEVGVGVAIVDGEIWVAEVFRKPAARVEQQAQPQPAPAPEPPPPAPEPQPAPQPQPAPPAAADSPAPAAPGTAASPAPAPTAPAPPASPPVPVETAQSHVAAAPDAVASAAGYRTSTAIAAERVAVAVPVPAGIPAAVEIAAGLLLAMVALQTFTLRRLGYV